MEEYHEREDYLYWKNNSWIAIDSVLCVSASARRALDSDGVLGAVNLKGAKSLVVVLRKTQSPKIKKQSEDLS